MAKVVVFGAGLAGSAFCVPLADQGHEVALVGTHVDGELIDTLAATGFHPRLKITLPPSVRPLPYTSLADALTDQVDLLVLAVSTAGVTWAIDQLGLALRTPVPILMLTKGMAAEDGELAVLPTVVERSLKGRGLAGVRVGGIGGPSLAAELAARRDTAAVVAYPVAKVGARLVRLIGAAYYHARPSTDVIGVEACAALKNLFALGVGAVLGRASQEPSRDTRVRMNNPAAAVFSQAVAELGYLTSALGGDPSTAYGPAGAGDLFVTCEGGRNGRMGQYLGEGLTYREAKRTKMPNDVIEGAELALAVGPTLASWYVTGRLDHNAVPLTRALIDAICHDQPLAVPWTRFNR